MRTTNLLLIVLLVAIIAIAGCTARRAEQTGTAEEVAEELPATAPEGAIVLEATDYKFSPDTITILSKENSKIFFVNSGKTAHALSIPGLGIQTGAIDPGKSIIVEVASDNSGTHSFYCPIGNHEKLGMIGTLNVWPKAVKE